jgi:NADPH:quinone reductase-like Zn-dependent oxidoreductase
VFQRGGLKPARAFWFMAAPRGSARQPFNLPRRFGATVFTTAGSEAKCAAMLEAGRGPGDQLPRKDFVEAVKEATGGKGADLILDMVGGDYITRNYQAAAIEGRIVQIAFLNGRKAEADFSLADDEAADPYRLNAARARHRLQGGIAERTAPACLAAAQ